MALKKQLKGDLDWITMKALEKDRTRRYASPSDLSADIGEQRNLADQHPEIVKQLESALEAWNKELAEPLWPCNRSTLTRPTRPTRH